MEEIKAIVKKYDIAANVILHYPIHVEYLHHIDTSWSCFSVNGDELRLKSKLSDYNGDKEKQLKVLNDTVNLVVNIGHILHRDAIMYDDLTRLLKERVEWDEGPGSDTSHLTQNQ